MNSGDRMGPAPTEGQLGEGKSSKTRRGPFTVRRSAGQKVAFRRLKGGNTASVSHALEGSGESAGILGPNLTPLGPSCAIRS